MYVLIWFKFKTASSLIHCLVQLYFLVKPHLEGLVDAVQRLVAGELQLPQLTGHSIISRVEVLDAQVCLVQKDLRHPLDGDGKRYHSVFAGPATCVAVVHTLDFFLGGPENSQLSERSTQLIEKLLKVIEGGSLLISSLTSLGWDFYFYLIALKSAVVE